MRRRPVMGRIAKGKGFRDRACLALAGVTLCGLGVACGGDDNGSPSSEPDAQTGTGGGGALPDGSTGGGTGGAGPGDRDAMMPETGGSGGEGPIVPPCEEDCPALDMVSFPAGSFEMGNPDGFVMEQPVRTVTLPAFQLMRAEVTGAEFAACVTAGVCAEPVPPSGHSDYLNWGAAGLKPGKESEPINGVRWDEARLFCAWLDARLPSEAEWEYAARGGGRDVDYPWGDEEPSCDRAVMAIGTETGCGSEGTLPVCSKPAGNTPEGLCDLAGNLAEWLEDDFHADYRNAPSDGSAWVDAPRAQTRVYRGGDWLTREPRYLATWARDHGSPALQSTGTGFRCAR